VPALLAIIAFVLVWNRRLGRAIRERERSERKIKAMSQAVDDALVMIDGRGKVLFWNPAAENLFGYTVAEAMDMDFHEMAVPAEAREKARGGIEAICRIRARRPFRRCAGDHSNQPGRRGFSGGGQTCPPSKWTTSGSQWVRCENIEKGKKRKRS